MWQWVRDWYGEYGSGAERNPQGSFSSSKKVIRGGSWSNVAERARASHRFPYDPGDRDTDLGFRLVAPTD